MTRKQRENAVACLTKYAQSKCFFFGPIISSVVALYTTRASPWPASANLQETDGYVSRHTRTTTTTTTTTTTAAALTSLR